MSKPEEGTSEFKVASLRDLLEGEESGKPAKGGGAGGGGGDRNRRLTLIGGAAVGVVALIVVVMLVAGGGGDGGDPSPADEDVFPASFEIRNSKVAQVERGDHISVCSPSTGPLAQDVEVTGKSVDRTAIGGFATVSVNATEEQAAKLTAIPDDTEVYEKNRCVRFNSTASTTAPPAEPTPETGPPDTTPATEPPS
ncbi:MAG: hypothetical protein ACRDYV_07305 [Acidimicrobiia bacterium]